MTADFKIYLGKMAVRILLDIFGLIITRGLCFGVREMLLEQDLGALDEARG